MGTTGTEILFIALTVSAIVTALFWGVQRILPGAINPKPVSLSTSRSASSADSWIKRILWAAIAVVVFPVWLNSLDKMLLAAKWASPFCWYLLGVVVLPVFFVGCLLRAVNGTSICYSTSDTPITNRNSSLPIDATTESEVRSLLAKGEKIEAVKRYRKASGVGLKEAKDFVEDIERHNSAG